MPEIAATPIIGAMTSLTRPMTSLIKKALLLLALASPVMAYAAEETEDTVAAAETDLDTAALYKLERSSAGDLPLDSRLRQLLPADTVVLTMEVGEQRFHALRQEADREEPVGGLLLVPDPTIGPAWVEQVAALRFDLAQKGWLTLALEPPQPDQQPLPERSLPVMQTFSLNSASAAAPTDIPAASAAQSSNSDTAAVDTPKTPLAPFAERFTERVDLTLEQLTERPLEPLVVIAFGRATPWVMEYLSQHPELNLSLVMIDPLPDSSPGAPLFANLWAAMDETPIVDIYHSPLQGYPQAAPDARIRKGQARREGLPNYLQARIAAPFTGWNEKMPWLTANVRGLIKQGILEPIAEKEEKQKQQEAQSPQGQTPPGMPIN